MKQIAQWLMAVSLGVTGDPTVQADNPSTIWSYTLLGDSYLVQSSDCGQPPVRMPLRGSFQLELTGSNPLYATYSVTNLTLELEPGWPPLLVTGHGHYQIGGQVALTQAMSLDLWLDDGTVRQHINLTNHNPEVRRLWPMLLVNLDQPQPEPLHAYRLELVAAPMREIWFSTRHGLTAGHWNWPTNQVSSGSLLSSTGRIVKTNFELTARLGFMPGVPDLELEAVDILPGGEVAFSIAEDNFSEVLGFLGRGDLLSDRGRIVARNPELLKRFGPMLPIPDVGLDAVQVMDSGEILFSIQEELFSQNLGVTLRPGDLLSDHAVVVRTHDDLLSRFHPPPIPRDFGLTALYVWPSGEIWFSIEEGFLDSIHGWIHPGDLLSDQGYVVYRSLDLVRPFQPMEDLADFGLDALFIVTDVSTSPASPPLRTTIQRDAGIGDLTLSWEGPGRVFQLESAPTVLGPWQPESPLLTTSPVVIAETIPGQRQGYYRVRQW